MAREMARIVDGRIELITDFFREFEHPRVTNCLVGKLLQSCSSTNEHHCDTVGQTEFCSIGTRRSLLVSEGLPEPVHRTFGGAANDFGHSLRCNSVFLSQGQSAIHIGMRYRTAGIGFECQFRDLPRPAKLAQFFERIFVGSAERAIEAMLAFENSDGTAKTFPSQHRCDHSAMRRPARMQSFGPRTICQIFDDAGALTAA